MHTQACIRVKEQWHLYCISLTFLLPYFFLPSASAFSALSFLPPPACRSRSLNLVSLCQHWRWQYHLQLCPKNDDKPREKALVRCWGASSVFQYGFSSGSPTLPLPVPTPTAQTCVRVAKFKQLLPGKCFQWKNIFVCSAKWRRGKSFILFGFVSFRFILLLFIWLFLLLLLCSLCFSPLQIFIEFE